MFFHGFLIIVVAAFVEPPLILVGGKLTGWKTKTGADRKLRLSPFNRLTRLNFKYLKPFEVRLKLTPMNDEKRGSLNVLISYDFLLSVQIITNRIIFLLAKK